MIKVWEFSRFDMGQLKPRVSKLCSPSGLTRSLEYIDFWPSKLVIGHTDNERKQISSNKTSKQKYPMPWTLVQCYTRFLDILCTEIYCDIDHWPKIGSRSLHLFTKTQSLREYKPDLVKRERKFGLVKYLHVHNPWSRKFV